MPSDTITVTMLSVLRGRFEAWLDLNGLLLAQTPDDRGGDNYVVVPDPARTDMYPPPGEGDF